MLTFLFIDLHHSPFSDDLATFFIPKIILEFLTTDTNNKLSKILCGVSIINSVDIRCPILISEDKENK